MGYIKSYFNKNMSREEAIKEEEQEGFKIKVHYFFKGEHKNILCYEVFDRIKGGV